MGKTLTKKQMESYDIELCNTQVFKTTNYSIFSRIVGNRPIHEIAYGCIRAKVKVENLTTHFPVVVNEKFEVIDGQHRLKACEEEGLPVHFVILKGADINTCRNVNIVGTNWGNEDFLNNYCEVGNEIYKSLKRYAENNKKYITLAQAIYLWTGGYSTKKSGFRNGTMKDKDENADAALELIKEIYELRSDAAKNSHLQKAIYSIVQIEGVSTTRLMNLLRKDPTRLTYLPYDNAKIKRLFEEIYNNGLKYYVPFFKMKKK